MLDLMCYILYCKDMKIFYKQNNFKSLNYCCTKSTGYIFMKLTGLIKEGIKSLLINFEVNQRKTFDLVKSLDIVKITL